MSLHTAVRTDVEHCLITALLLGQRGGQATLSTTKGPKKFSARDPHDTRGLLTRGPPSNKPDLQVQVARQVVLCPLPGCPRLLIL